LRSLGLAADGKAEDIEVEILLNKVYQDNLERHKDPQVTVNQNEVERPHMVEQKGCVAALNAWQYYPLQLGVSMMVVTVGHLLPEVEANDDGTQPKRTMM
jgi:hypothetical protein